MQLAQELYEPNAGLLTIAAICLAGWYLVLAVLVVIRWPKSPSPGPATHDLRPESPAVANLLTHGWLSTEDSMPATLLDLSARGFVAIEDRGDGQIQCRVNRSRDQGPLTTYEERIVAHLDRLSTDGVVPAGALTTGPKDQSKRWWRSFTKEVAKEAKSNGVARDFWPIGLTVVMVALAIPIYLLWESAQGFRDTDEVQMTPLLTVVTYTLFGAIVPLGYLTGTFRLRDTAAGRVAAAHWLGVRKDLESLPTFPDLPPDAVATWERHLAYGAALGVAARAVRSLPLGAEHDKRAWTDYSGHWKQVTIGYPRLRPEWGRNPGVALVISVLRTTLISGALWFAASLDIFDTATYGEFLPWWGRLGVFVAGLAFVALAVWSAVGIVWAILDIGRAAPVNGEVLRTRVRSSMRGGDDEKLFFVAVYTGEGERVDAWRVSNDMYYRFYQGQVVEVLVTPRLGYVQFPEDA